jgi:hypothetical protein
MYGYWYCYLCGGYHTDTSHMTKDFTVYHAEARLECKINRERKR